MVLDFNVGDKKVYFMFQLSTRTGGRGQVVCLVSYLRAIWEAITEHISSKQSLSSEELTLAENTSSKDS